MSKEENVWHGTTIVYVKKAGDVVIAGDGQVTLGSQIIKNTSTKLRKLGDDNIIAGFSGATADALALFERLKQKLQQNENNLEKSVVELSKDWRTDHLLRKLEAMMIVADIKNAFILTGSGDVLKPEIEGLEKDGNEICAIGSGGGFALSAGKALLNNTKLSCEDVARQSLKIASEICIYTNNHVSVLKLTEPKPEKGSKK